MRQSKKTEIANVCYAVVSGNFATFCNEKYRGFNFNWENFARMQESQIRTQLWVQISMPENKKMKEEMENLAAQYAREISERLVGQAGFCEQKKV